MNRDGLQKLLKNFVSEKRVGVLETGMKEKTFYFIPPALDPISTSPIATLSYVADGCYKQFCHLLYVRRRMHSRAKATASQTRVSRHASLQSPSTQLQPRFIPHSPDSPPPKRPYQLPPRLPSQFPPQLPPQQPFVPYPPPNYPPPNYPPNYPRFPPRGPMNYPPRDGAYMPPGYPPRPGAYGPRGPSGYPPRGPAGYPPPMMSYPPGSNRMKELNDRVDRKPATSKSMG